MHIAKKTLPLSGFIAIYLSKYVATFSKQ